MKLIVLFLFFTIKILAQNPVAPNLEFVMELKVTTDPAQNIGPTSHGVRRFIPITGGTFEGPNLKGNVLNGGADYQFFTENTKGDSRTEIEAIYTIKTDDNVLIHIRNEGLVVRIKEENVPQKTDNQADYTKLYFRAAPKFEAPANSKYDWMNNALFVCKGIPTGKGYVIIQVWKVL